jgi:hypothetical protein
VCHWHGYSMLIYGLLGKEYDDRKVQDAGHGRSDITALIFEFKLPAI